MCYNEKVSIATFLTVSGISLFLWLRDNKIDRAVSLIIFVIVFIQLLEFIIWSYQDKKECNPYNRVASLLIPYVITTQIPLIALIIKQMDAGTGIYYDYIIYSWFPLVVWATYELYKDHKFDFTKDNCIRPGNSNHLDWNINFLNTLEFRPDFMYLFYLFIYYVGGTYVFSTLKNRLLSYVFSGGLFISGAINYFHYERVWGSMWCHAANFMGMAAIFC